MIVDPALVRLLAALDAHGHAFVAPTPATHARVVARPDMRRARDLRGVFGWSLPCAPDLLPDDVREAAQAAGVLEPAGDGLVRSTLRGSRVRGRLFLHSAYPTDAPDSVFLGPDTYRFADFVLFELDRTPPPVRVVDIGAGAGVGGVLTALARPGAQVRLADVNPRALELAVANAAHAGAEVETAVADGLEGMDGPFDLVLANPPYIVDPAGRAYRDGGDMHGARLSLDWALAAAGRLAPGGRLLLYTGAAVVDGRDPLREALERELPSLGCRLSYRELDPDVFGEELEGPAYADVERIAAVGAVVERGA